MRACVWAAVLLALAAAAIARRTDQDFEFDDSAELEETPAAVSDDGGSLSDDGGSLSDDGGSLSAVPPSRRYVYDPHNSLCRSLVCKKREICVLRDAFTALCATKKDIIRNGDTLVSAGAGAGVSAGAWGADEDDDVFYDAGAQDDVDDDPTPDRCVGCPVRARATFLCGSDNRTYSSLCRLDLHNCVRRPAAAVRLACRGFCPCRAHAHRQRTRTYKRDYEKRTLESSHNEVLPERSPHRRQPQGCALDKMADRLLDWFSVLMEAPPSGDSSLTPGADELYPADCKPEVRWMFHHLDTDGDGLLSDDNLYALRHDDRERCLRPFLASCGGGRGGRSRARGGGARSERGGGSSGGGVTRGEWCACLRRAVRPCTALANAHPNPRPGAWVPLCDAHGYYRPRQCHAALGVCWCVDAHGQEVPHTRTKGKPLCPERKQVLPVEGGSEPGAPDDDEDGAGSGDRAPELRY